MIERIIIWGGLIFGIFSFPTLFKKPSIKIWLPLYLINCIINYLFNKALVETKKLKYPVRSIPKVFEINATYDFLVCPFISIWYCQSIYNSKLPSVIGKLFIFAIPQGIYEVFLEKKTELLEFKGNWKWIHSIFLVFIVKIISLGSFKIIKRIYSKPFKQEEI